MRTFALALALVVLPPCSLHAQRVIPAIAAARDMNSQSLFPFVYNVFHYQQVWNGAAVANTNASINGIAYRRDVQDNSTWTGHSLSTLTIRMGHTSVSPTTMSTTFTANVTSALTTVFTGPYNMPTLNPAIGLPPFGIVMPLQSPFPFQTASGNLIVDLESQASPMPKMWYPIDADYVGQNGRTFQLGTSGNFSSGTAPNLVADSRTSPLSGVIPGGQVTPYVTNIPSPLTTFIGFGLSTQFWSGGLLPFDVGQLGAPGNTLYVSPDVFTTALTPVAQGRSYVVRFTAPIPNLPVLAGESFYNQAIILDPSANSLGAVFTRGLQVLIGGMTGAADTQLMGTPSTTSPRGNFPFGTAGSGGPVIEFRGTFN